MLESAAMSDEVLAPERLLKRAKNELARELLEQSRVKAAELFEHHEGVLRCTACAHRCAFSDDRVGACGVRHSNGGVLYAPHGWIARKYVRPIETNTVYHVLPGAQALTFGLYGCDLRCPYCHNARISQALRDGTEDEQPITISAEELVREALEQSCKAICAAYNEPMIAAEWVRDVFTVAKSKGLTTVIVSDGHSTPEAIDLVAPVTDVFRVDLKAATPEQYKQLGGRLEPVLASIAHAKAKGLWVEVVTLVVPGFNDDARGLRDLAKAIAKIDPNIPWHLNAFQPRYRMSDRPAMDAGTLVSLAGTAYARGLSFVYASNTTFAELEHTRCPSCHEVLIERDNFKTTRVTSTCPKCATQIPGLFSQS